MMVHLTTEQLQKLQDLSNINLTPTEQAEFLVKLDPVISKLEELNNIDVSSVFVDDKIENSLRGLDFSIDSKYQSQVSKSIMENVKHEIINNSIVIKSVLS